MNESVRVVDPVGRDGITLDDVWGHDDATAYLGITMPGFPNLFLMQGPSTGLGHGGSAIFQAESQVRYIYDAIVRMIERGHRRDRSEATVSTTSTCASSMNGTPSMIWTPPGHVDLLPQLATAVSCSPPRGACSSTGR